MRAAVILVWRPKHFPDWHGRSSPSAGAIPPSMAYDRSAAPYTAIHLASLLPRHWEVTVVHEMARDVDLDVPVDVVFLSTMDFCAPHARWLGRQFRARGAMVVAGGLYPTLNPGYFAGAADAVVVGEAEPVLPQLIADLERRRPAPTYRAASAADLRGLPPPRYEVVERDFTVASRREVNGRTAPLGYNPRFPPGTCPSGCRSRSASSATSPSSIFRDDSCSRRASSRSAGRSSTWFSRSV